MGRTPQMGRKEKPLRGRPPWAGDCPCAQRRGGVGGRPPRANEARGRRRRFWKLPGRRGGNRTAYSSRPPESPASPERAVTVRVRSRELDRPVLSLQTTWTV